MRLWRWLCRPFRQWSVRSEMSRIEQLRALPPLREIRPPRKLS